MSVDKIPRAEHAAEKAHAPLTVQQAALYLRCTTRSIYRYRHDAGIGYIGRDGRLYFTREELDRLATWYRTPREA